MESGARAARQLEHRSEGDRAIGATDGVLAGRIRSGDAEALGELFDRDGPAALAVANGLVADVAVAEDIVHDAFVTIWQKIGEFDGGRDTLASWVLAWTRQHAAQRLPAGADDVTSHGAELTMPLVGATTSK